MYYHAKYYHWPDRRDTVIVWISGFGNFNVFSIPGTLNFFRIFDIFNFFNKEIKIAKEMKNAETILIHRYWMCMCQSV